MKKIFTLGILALMIVSVAGFVSATPPTITGLQNMDAFEDTKLTFTVTVTDAQVDTTPDQMTLSFSPQLPGAPAAVLSAPTINGLVATWTFTWTPTDNEFGEHALTFTAKDTPTSTVTDSVNGTMTIDVFPQLCEKGKVGNDVEITDLDLDESEYMIGDDIALDVDVKNKASKDLDINVEAFLWDVKEEDNIDDFDSDTMNINDGDTDTFEADFTVPFDNDLDEDGDFVILVKAYEDGDEDRNCDVRRINVDITRDNNDVIVRDVTVNPSVAEPGQNVEFSIEVLNAGSKDQNDVAIEVINTQLGVNLKSNVFDIERAGDSDDQTERFTVKIPENAQARDYSFTIRVLDEDGDVYDRGEEFVTLTVAGQAKPTAELELVQSNFEVNAGSSANLLVTVRNTGTSVATYVIDVTPTGGWTNTISQIVSVEGDSESQVTIPLSVKSDAATGSYTALVELKSGSETLATKNVVVTVKSTGLEPVTGGTVFTPRASSTNISTVFWIIADVALVVVIAYFLTLLFRKRK